MLPLLPALAVCHHCVSVVVQVRVLGSEADRLAENHEDQAEHVAAKRAEIDDNWSKLRNKVHLAVFIVILLC